ncbi:DUF3632 domain-containing protein [Pseudosporangium ferrugineum]|uniref:DUF3632 domain-containing protein n=1 Tax=Pseudosporangium ferrugineum TaxID=439699 RepID=UPI001304E2C5|nr:DUF3632 domain-containing protein [Pseudosporangium ferrugineum]
MTPSSWLSRYRAGQRRQVWRELAGLGPAVHERPDLADEAQLVCDEMARRARRNVEVLAARLTAAGYRFHTNDDEQLAVAPHLAPTPGAEEHVRWLEARFGPVPMTLRSWIRLVGDVWLVGTHPRWPGSGSGDPLVIQLEGTHDPGESIRDYFDGEHEEWEDSGSGPFVLPVAPDRLHKANTSGGDPYGIVLSGAADGVFAAGRRRLPFVSYLNRVFAHGGFPHRTWARPAARIKRDLARDLLPL